MFTQPLCSMTGLYLLAGGLLNPNPPGDGSSVAEIFDPTTNTFTATGSLITGRYFHTATNLGNGDVLVTGGSSRVHSRRHPQVRGTVQIARARRSGIA